MQHRHHRHHCQHKGQHITKAEVVIDIAEQHKNQYESQRETLFGGNDENAALRQRDRADFYFRAEQPDAEFLLECGYQCTGFG